MLPDIGCGWSSKSAVTVDFAIGVTVAGRPLLSRFLGRYRRGNRVSITTNSAQNGGGHQVGILQQSTINVFKNMRIIFVLNL